MILIAYCFGAVVSCSGSNPRAYREGLRKVRSVAKIGSSIDVARSELIARGFDVSDLHEQRNLKEPLWMNVPYGAVMSVGDGLRYAAGLPDDGTPSSITVKATPNRKITSVE
jgi:hypothetical protein